MKVTVKIYNSETGGIETFHHENVTEVRDYLDSIEVIEVISHDSAPRHLYAKKVIVAVIYQYKDDPTATAIVSNPTKEK